MTLAYRIDITPEEGTLLVRCPALPSLITFGETEAEAIHWAHDAAYVILYGLLSDFEDIPPSDATEDDVHVVRIEAVTSLRLQLHQLLRELGVTRAELARRLHWHPKAVDALFRLEEREGLTQLEAAFRVLDRTLEVTVRTTPTLLAGVGARTREAA